MPFDFCLGGVNGGYCRDLEDMKSETWVLRLSASPLPNFVLTMLHSSTKALRSCWWPYTITIALSLVYGSVPSHCLSALGIVIAPCSYKSWILLTFFADFLYYCLSLVDYSFPIYSI